MSLVVKNSRRCRPRARWKIVAPCITVLSTSKNAADVESASTLRALSTSAMAAAASPASCERRCRLGGREGDLRPGLLRGGGGVTAPTLGGNPRTAGWSSSERNRAIGRHSNVRDSSDGLQRRRAVEPGGLTGAGQDRSLGGDHGS